MPDGWKKGYILFSMKLPSFFFHNSAWYLAGCSQLLWMFPCKMCTEGLIKWAKWLLEFLRIDSKVLHWFGQMAKACQAWAGLSMCCSGIGSPCNGLHSLWHVMYALVWAGTWGTPLSRLNDANSLSFFFKRKKKKCSNYIYQSQPLHIYWYVIYASC